MDSDAIREKWDARYRDTHRSADSIAEVLTNNHHLLPTEGRALDLAAGLGGNALYLAQTGLEVYAWDISPVAIDRLNTRAQQQDLTVHAQVRDCIAQPPEPNSFDVIVISRFLERELCPAISAALRPRGLLLYQTWRREKRCDDGPGNPDFLLESGELPRLFPDLEVLLHEEGDEARFIGRKRRT